LGPGWQVECPINENLGRAWRPGFFLFVQAASPNLQTIARGTRLRKPDLDEVVEVLRKLKLLEK
jgi:hypothetical protein